MINLIWKVSVPLSVQEIGLISNNLVLLEFIGSEPEKWILEKYGVSMETPESDRMWGAIQCLSSLDGTVKWEFGKFAVCCNLTSSSGLIYVGTQDHCVSSIRCNDGTIVHKDILNAAPNTIAMLSDNQIAIGDMSGGIYVSDELSKNTRKLNSFNHQISEILPLDPDHLVCRNSEEEVYAISIHTGEVIWQTQLPMFSYGEWVIQDGMLYTPFHADIAAINVSTGEVKSLYKGAREITSGLYQLSNGRIVFAVPEKIQCIDSETGALVWTVNTSDLVYGKMFPVGDKYLVAGCHDGTLIVIDETNGEIVDSISAGNGIETCDYSDGIIYCGHSGNIVTAHSITLP